MVQHGLLHGSASLGSERVAGGSSLRQMVSRTSTSRFRERPRAGGTDEPRFRTEFFNIFNTRSLPPRYHSGVAHLRVVSSTSAIPRRFSLGSGSRSKNQPERGDVLRHPLPFRGFVTRFGHESNAPAIRSRVLYSLSRCRVSPLTMFLSCFCRFELCSICSRHWTRRHPQERVSRVRQTAAIWRRSDTGNLRRQRTRMNGLLNRRSFLRSNACCGVPILM